MSTFPAMIPADVILGTHFLAFEDGGFTPWEYQDNSFAFSPQEPIFSNSGSDDSNPDQKTNGEAIAPVDERKRRRMISNRESARRSRMRKQKHLENLRNQANRLKLGNRELMNRLRLVRYHEQLVQQENDWLRRESVALQQKLWDIRQVLLNAWPGNINPTLINEQIPPSLIT